MNLIPANNTQNKKVIVGMSGGVDSSVAALLLLQQGYQVEGLFMKNWDEDDDTEYCTAKVDLADAQLVCDILGIKLHTANFAAEYWDNVFEYFLQEYKSGRTPNPDILCNREIKFKVFIEYAELLGADLIATGHYARREDKDNKTYLLKGLDNNKDQSYFLHAVGSHEFSKTLFPVGELEKPVVRALAEQHNLVTHNKKDSTGICFIGERRFKDFLQTYIPAQPGNIVTDKGSVIGQHQGLMYHTIGQRQGLGIGGVKNAGDAPWYVADKNLDANELLIVQGSDATARFRCNAKIRYRQADQACEVIITSTENKQTQTQQDPQSIVLKVIFDKPQRAITPGQSIVFYDGNVCLGGAVIQNRH
jgi:tRNA-specific 2-thiouridylase